LSELPKIPMSKMTGIQSGWRSTMPLWKVYHPVGAYSVQDKKEFAEKVTEMYSRIPIPEILRRDDL
jgi:Putative oxalocrotonate tautomerase enzyme